MAGLLHPVSELRFIELALVDVEVADFLVLGCAGRERTRIALQEADQLYVAATWNTPSVDGTIRAQMLRREVDKCAHAGRGLLSLSIYEVNRYRCGLVLGQHNLQPTSGKLGRDHGNCRKPISNSVRPMPSVNFGGA